MFSSGVVASLQGTGGAGQAKWRPLTVAPTRCSRPSLPLLVLSFRLSRARFGLALVSSQEAVLDPHHPPAQTLAQRPPAPNCSSEGGGMKRRDYINKGWLLHQLSLPPPRTGWLCANSPALRPSRDWLCANLLTLPSARTCRARGRRRYPALS